MGNMAWLDPARIEPLSGLGAEQGMKLLHLTPV